MLKHQNNKHSKTNANREIIIIEKSSEEQEGISYSERKANERVNPQKRLLSKNKWW